MDDFDSNKQFRHKLYGEWLTTIKSYGSKIGFVQILESYPAFLVKRGNDVIYRNVHTNYLVPNEERNHEIAVFLTRKFETECQSEYYSELMDEAIRTSSFYWIFKSNKQYAIGLDGPVNFHFIVFQDFLMVDYDHPSRLKILYEFCRLHPEYKFRVCQTTKGWHAFLTSHKIPYSQEESIKLLKRLGSDPLYRHSVAKKGYSVRLNRKSAKERMHIDYRIVGTGAEIGQLVRYFDLVQTLKNQYWCGSLVNLTHNNARRLFKEHYKL